MPLQNSLTSVFSGLTGSLSNSLATAAGGGTTVPSWQSTGLAAGGATNVVFNVQAADAQSFRRSESQINAMLTRAVGRGRRGN